jgi:hypothetical protein
LGEARLEARKFVDDGELRGITFDSTGGYGRAYRAVMELAIFR